LATARKELFALMALREGNSHAAAIAATPTPDAAASVKAVFNGFLADREARMMDGRLEKGTFLDYRDALETFVAGLECWHPDPPDSVSLLKRQAPLAALRPEHFRHTRKIQSKGVGSYVLERRVQRVRTAFRWGWEIGRLITAPPYYGDDYHKPSKAEKRADKRKTVKRGGEPRFSINEIASILHSDELKPVLTAMVWLALNSGMYSADCAVLRRSDIRKEEGETVVDTYREKTGIRQKLVHRHAMDLG
jgi:hypothetical protein